MVDRRLAARPAPGQEIVCFKCSRIERQRVAVGIVAAVALCLDINAPAHAPGDVPRFGFPFEPGEGIRQPCGQGVPVGDRELAGLGQLADELQRQGDGFVFFLCGSSGGKQGSTHKQGSEPAHRGLLWTGPQFSERGVCWKTPEQGT